MPRAVVVAMSLLLASVGAAAAQDLQRQCEQNIRNLGGPCMDDGVPLSVTSRTGILAQEHRDVVGLVVGRDNFPEASRIFGRATRWSSGDAASAETKVCYVAHGAGGTVTLVLAQNAEMSEQIDEIRLISGRIDAASRCARLRVAPESLRTRTGLRVGMSRNQVVAILGTPTYEHDGMLIYYWAKYRELRPEDPSYKSCLSDGKSIATLGSGVTLRIEHGVVTWLTIGYGAYSC